MNKEAYYITTAIAYTSAKPHIGNTYEIIFTDAIARFKRAQGYDVFFQTGTDEHGQKIELNAQKAGITPKAFVDQIAKDIKANFDLMNTSYDNFVRTTDDNHIKVVQQIFKKLYEQGDIYKGRYEGLYCTPCESFWTESQLVDGRCPDCGGEVHPSSEEAYFFDLSKYSDRLVDHIEKYPEFIQPESRKNEMINNFIKPGLQDLCVSRTSFSWGVPVDFDEGHVVYVWIDALSNYISSLGFDVNGNQGELYKKYWPAKIHIIGKDILRFHTIYWPIMLMALDQPLPKQIFGHPWILFGEDKMSKSKGNIIYAEDLVEYFGVDAVRYYVLNEIPFAQDGSITWELIVERINSDLANVLGNLVNRTISMSNKYFDGVVENPQVQEEIDLELITLANNTARKVEHHMDSLHINDAIKNIFTLLRRSNKYIDETLPWALAKDESKQERLQTVLYNLLESIRISAVLLHSFIPDTATKILDQLNTSQRSLESARSFGNLEVDIKVCEKPEILFARLDLEEIIAQVEAEKEVVAHKPEITIEDFDKVEMCLGKIIECKPHPKADRLLIFQVEFGKEVRQIVSGIAKFYSPEVLIGKNVVAVTNLKPVTLRGVASNGMLLTVANEDDSELDLLTIQKELATGLDVK